MTHQDSLNRQVAKSDKEKLIELLLKSKGVKRASGTDIAARKSNSPVPLSFAQQRLWFIDQLEGGSAAYNVPAALRLKGNLKPNLLQQSLNAVISRHESLRTQFMMEKGEPVQKVLDDLSVAIRTIDLTNLADSERWPAMQAMAYDEAGQSFDLTQAPLIRATLYKYAPDDYHFFLTLHHIICDGWSVGIFIRELALLYGSAGKMRPGKLPPLPIQYPDFALWQREHLNNEAFSEDLAYWKSHLHGAPATISLPTDHRRPPVLSPRGDLLAFEIDEQTSAKLQALALQEGASLFMVLLSAFAVLLHRYSGQEDLVIGSPIANRNHESLESLIGFFVNTLALRINVSDDPLFTELLTEVKQTALNAYDHQGLPFEMLVEEIQPERKMDQNPLFQLLFVLQNAPMEALKLPELSVAPRDEFHNGTVKFDLEMYLWESPLGLSGKLLFRNELFGAERIQRMISHYRILLKSIVDNPKARVSRLPIIDTAEQQVVLDGFTTQPVEHERRRNHCLHICVEEQARRTPHAVALRHDGQSFTYQELNARANQLARRLQRHGVHPGALVGIFTRRTPEAVIGLLSILKSGGAYVPLDPSYPKKRLQLLFENASMAAILTQSELVDSIPPTSSPLIVLDDPLRQPVEESEENLSVSIAPENLAYVLFTSGSTGRPKGVAIEHRNAVAFLDWARQAFSRDQMKMVLASTSLCFDLSVFELFATLDMGGTIFLVDDVLELSRITEDCPVTLINTVPSAINELLKAGDIPASVTTVNLAGEPLMQKTVNSLYELGTIEHVYNLYGPSEDTTYSTYALMTANIDQPPVIGRPIAGTQAYLLDRHLSPVPIGVPGEIYLGGLGLARGYLNRPDLTAANFIPNPFSSTIGARLYKTGDMGIFSTDGEIQFLGRIDHQVKIRGYRIEMAEVESALAKHPGVQDNLVMVREDIPDRKQLVAYIKPNSEHALNWRKNSSSQSEHLATWQAVFEDTYALEGARDDTTFNFAGWTSSYTGLPIPDEQMQDWVEQTVSIIRSFKSEKVLELGCGTGLLLGRIAAECKRYVGTDFSQGALDNARRMLKRIPNAEHVTLHQLMADDLSGLEKETFDTVILNSVVQYFPDTEYLCAVLKGALKVLQPGGRVLVGDVRNLALLRAFHSSVQLHQAPDDLGISELIQRINTHSAQESELLLDPGFFYELFRSWKEIGDIRMLLKRSRYKNEMTQFRYDVILHKRPCSLPAGVVQEIDWHATKCRMDKLHRILVQERPDSLWVRNIPNSRLIEEVYLDDILSDPERFATVGQLRRVLQQKSNDGVDPYAFLSSRFTTDIGIKADLMMSASGEFGCFDILFYKNDMPVTINKNVPSEKKKKRSGGALRDYANHPLTGKYTKELVPSIQTYLRSQLPDFMVPDTIIMLEDFPLLPNGKVNRKDLPSPHFNRGNTRGHYVGPRTEIESTLADLWSEVLNIAPVGIYDSFFDLGGHSLLAMRVVTGMRDTFGVHLPVRQLFETPTIEGLAKALSAARDAKKASQKIAPALRTDSTPLSFSQERMWFLDRLENRNAAYNLPMAVKLEGSCRVDALEKSLRRIVGRHEILRTVFVTKDGKPVQKVIGDTSIELERLDLSALADSERLEAVEKRLVQEAGFPFDLTNGPLIRACLVKLETCRHLLLITKHHIISDGWSIGIFIRELSAFYASIVTNREPQLASLPIQYADYAIWQRQWLAGKNLDSLIDYWKNKLNGAPRMLELPLKGSRPPVQTYSGASVHFAMGRDLSASLDKLSRATGASLFMTLLSVFGVLLCRYSRQTDLLIGTPVANRSLRQIEDLIGCFVNTLVLRLGLSGNPTFKAFIRRVRKTALDAFAHQELPFEILVDALDSERSLSSTPLFQVFFTLQNNSVPPLALPDLKCTPVPIECQQVKFDLNLAMEQTPDGLAGSFEYNTDLFNHETIVAMKDHFVALAAKLTEAPDLNVMDVDLVSPAEQHKMIVEWNATRSPYPSDVCLHHLVREQVDRTPDEIAVSFGDDALSYAELDHKANRLANYLLSLGFSPEYRVGVYMERSIEMVIVLLAILKSGGAYVPLDPDYPDHRIAYMIEDSAVSIIITAGKDSQVLSNNTARKLRMDKDWALIAKHAVTPPSLRIPSQCLAYVIYTSGSTGRPKGVSNTHAGIVNRLLWMQSAYGLRPGVDRVLQKTPFGFDVSVWEFFWPLISGARLVMAEPAGHRDAAYLVKEIRERKITTLHFVPSMLNVFLKEPGVKSLDGLKRVICSGEALTAENLREYYQAMNADLHNLYGPTEAAVDVTFWACRPSDAQSAVPIGRPIANTCIYVLDKRMKPVPPGIAGELYIGGRQLARGYVNRPGKTAQSFVPNPFSDAPGGRMYKTGDLVRYRSDGVIEYLGRLDFQVKIRGVRIELGEIESHLVSMDGIQEAVVLPHRDHSGDTQLIAYIVGNQENPPDIARLRRSLREFLPGHMIPAAFVVLDAMPINSSGKLDRQALPLPDISNLIRGIDYQPPVSEMEKLLAALWSEVLNTHSIGVNDNFFDLGGHSLLATQVASRLRDKAGIQMPVRKMFEHPTISELAEDLSSLDMQPGRSTEIEPIVRPDIVPLSFAQERLWFMDQVAPGNPFYNMPVALRMDGHLIVTAMEKAINEVAARHESLRTIFPSVDGQPIQIIKDNVKIALPVIPLEDDSVEAVYQCVRQEAISCFDLAQGPLIRCKLLRLAPTAHVLMITIHHIVSDGWSGGVFVRELAALYEAFVSGSVSPLEPLPVQYADFAIWQRKQLTGERLEVHRKYWLRQLSRMEVLRLPLDRTRPGLPNYSGQARQMHIDVERLEQLNNIGRSHGASLFMTLTAAFTSLLSRYSGQTDVVIGAPIANRNNTQTESLIGFFVNTLVLRADFSGNPSFGEHLENVRQTTLDAYAHQDFPFERLVEELRPVRDSSANPLVQVVFAFQNAPIGSFKLPDLTLSPLESLHQRVRFDLEVHVWEATDGLRGTFIYNSDLFELETIDRIIESFKILLAGITADPNLRHLDLPLADSCLPLRQPLDTPQSLEGLTSQQADTLLAKLLENKNMAE